MKTKLKYLALTVFTLAAICNMYSQGYIVTNGVIYLGYQPSFGGYEIDVVHDPTNFYYTGFSLNPKGKTPPTTLFTNIFS